MSSLLNRWKLNQDLGISNEIENTDGEFSKGVSRAWENTKATTKAAIGAMGAEDYLLAADFNQREAQKYAPAVAGVTDIRSLSDAGDWLAGTAGESVVNLGTLVAGGGVGGLAARGAAKALGSAALKQSTRLGATAGLVGTSYPQQFGENIQAVRAEHGGALTEGSVPMMALTAVAQTALDTLPVMGVLGRLGLADKARRDILQKTLTSPTRIRQIGRDLGGLALKEGTTEVAQEAMKLGALEWIDSNKDHFGIEQMKQLVDSFAAGAVGGAIMGAPVAGLNALHSDKPWFRKAAVKDEASASELLALPSPGQVMAHPDDVYRVDKSGTTSVAPPTNVELVSKVRKDADGNIIQERHPLLALPAQAQPHPDDVYAVDNTGNIVGYASPASVELKRAGMADRDTGSILGLKPKGYDSGGFRGSADESVNTSSVGLYELHSDKPWFRHKEIMKGRAIKRFEESGNIEQFEEDKNTIRGFIAQQLAAEARQAQSSVNTPVVAHPEDEGVWVGADGGEYESGQAYVIKAPSDPSLVKSPLIDPSQAEVASISAVQPIKTGEGEALKKQEEMLNDYRLIKDHFIETDAVDGMRQLNEAYRQRRGALWPDYMASLDEYNQMRGGGFTEADLVRDRFNVIMNEGSKAAIVEAAKDVGMRLGSNIEPMGSGQASAVSTQVTPPNGDIEGIENNAANIPVAEPEVDNPSASIESPQTVTALIDAAFEQGKRVVVVAEDDKGSVVIPYADAMDAQGMALYQEREFEKPDEVIEKQEKKAEAVDSSVRFSRTGSTVGSAKNTVVDEEESRALVEGFRRRFRGAIDIQVVDNFYGLPLAVLEAAHQQAFDPSEIRGVLHTDTVYLVRENHRSVAEVEATLFHEIYAHSGFRKLFGENLSKQFNHLFLALGGTQKIIERGAKHGHNLQVYWDSFEQAGYSNEDKRAALVDELFAHLSQNQANASFSQKALQLAKELYGAIRQWLREHGFKRLSETSEADVAYLLKQAREALGKPPTSHDKGKPQFLRTPMFSRKARESGLSASGDANLWAELQAQAPKEGMARNKELLGKGWQWTKDHIQEVVKTGGLGLLTLRQLAEIGKDVVPAMQKYMALTERMLTERNQMADESGKLAERWTKLDKATRQKLAFVMHKSTLERVDPSLDQVPNPEIMIRVADLEWREKLGLARPASLLVEVEPERLAVNDGTTKLLYKRYQEANNKALRSRGQRERFEQLQQVADSLLGDWKAAKAALQQYERALPVFERLQQQFRALSPEAQAIYTESRDMYEARFARKHQALIESINRSVMPDERKRALARTLQQEFESAKLQGVYFPLHRQGAYFVRGDVKKEQVSETVYFKKAGFERINRGTGEVTQEANTWDSKEAALRSANSRSDLIGKDLIAVEQDGGWVLKENPSEPLFLMFPTAAEAEREAGRLQSDSRYSDVKLGKLNKQNTQDELGRAGVLMQTMAAMKANNQDVPDELYQLMLEMLPELSMRKNSIHRKGVQGFSADALNAFGHQMLHQAHQISKLEARDQLAQALSDMEEQAKLVPNEQRMLAGNLREEMKKRHDWVMSPKNAAWTNWTSSFGFVMYLGISPAAALVNLSQVAIVGYPALAAKYGWAEAAKTLNATARQLNLREVVMGDDAISRAALSSDEQAAMNHWHDEGVIDKSQAQMLAGVADNDALSNSPTYQRAMGKVAHLFHKAEVVNREVMLLSAYRLARAKGETHEQAVQYASDVTWETQFDYSNANRAGFMQNDFAKVALMFKSYSQHMIYFLLRNARQWGKGGADAKEARSKLLGILAVTLAMGGVSALPLGFVGAATGFAYAQAKFGTKAASIGTVGAVAGLMVLSAAVLDDEEDWESELRKTLRNMGGDPLETLVFRGAVNLTTGVDLSSRISLDDLLLRDSDRELEGADAKGALLEQLAGPVVGYGVNALYTAPELWSQDHEWRAVEKLMPKFARDWMQTARFGAEGALTMKGSPIVESDELNVWNLFWKANGFNAEKLTGQYVANNDFMNAKKRVQDSREKVLNRLFVASVENDHKAVLEAKAAIKDWNQAHPKAKQINEAAMKRSLAARLRARKENDQGVRVQAAEAYLRE